MSKAEEVREIKAKNPQMRNVEIARILKCSPANVCKALQQTPRMIVKACSRLPAEKLEYLKDEAKRNNVALHQMAMAFLIDALHDAMES